MVHKVADDLPKKDFKDRYGKEKGDAVRFGTATNMVKKKLGLEELELDELSVTGVATKKLQMYYNKFKDAVTKTEISILNNIKIIPFFCPAIHPNIFRNSHRPSPHVNRGRLWPICGCGS